VLVDMPPEIPVDALPAAEQAAPEDAMPAGSVIIGLIPGAASSVATSGMPVGANEVPV
jgi:hypothetical protein